MTHTAPALSPRLADLLGQLSEPMRVVLVALLRGQALTPRQYPTVTALRDRGLAEYGFKTADGQAALTGPGRRIAEHLAPAVCDGGSAACSGTVEPEHVDTPYPYCRPCRVAAAGDAAGDDPVQGPELQTALVRADRLADYAIDNARRRTMFGYFRHRDLAHALARVREHALADVAAAAAAAAYDGEWLTVEAWANAGRLVERRARCADPAAGLDVRLYLF